MANADIIAIVGANTTLLDEALNKAVSKPRKVNLSINNDLSGSLGRIRAQLGEFDKSLAASNARVLAFGASAGAMYAVGRSIKELVKSTVEVEKRLTGINSILGASKSEFSRFGNELFRIAQETSSSFGDVADAAEELARQGVGIEETLKRTSSAMKLVRISGVSAVTAVEAMTAALNTNNDVLLTSESLINKLAAVDAKFAVSAAGLTEALKRVGSVAVDAGFSIDELIAAVTSAQQTTARGEAVIGNSLKTIFTRAQRPKVLEDFQSLGIETKNAAGNIRPLKDILIEVAKQYDNLSSAQQSNISELVGGVYQINILKALFRDLGKETSIFGRAFEESFGATDQASQRVSQLNETLDALFKRFSVNLTKFGSQSGNAAFAPLGKSLLKGMNTTLETVTSELGDKKDLSGRILEGMFKGLGNALSGPLLIGGLAVLIKLLRDWRVQGMDAIKTLSGLNRSFHNLEIVSSSVGNFLKEHPTHLMAISSASKTAEGSTRALAAATADYVKWASQRAEVDQFIGRASGVVAQRAISQGVYSAPVAGKGETLQVRKASGGLIPQVMERMGAYAGGYTPGNVREMNVPGMGRVYYNTAENVKQFPGMSQPAIMPPRNSEAGRKYEQNFANTHGFSPYNAGGLIPFKKQRDAAKEYVFGNENSPGREGMFTKAFAASLIPTTLTSATGTSESRGGKIATEITDAISLGLTIGAFARGKGGGKLAVGAGVITGLMGVVKQATNSFNTLDAEVNDLKNKIQKAGDGMGMYGQTLEQLQNAYMDSSVSAIQIVKLQEKLAQTLVGLPEELRKQLMSAKTLEQVQEVGTRYAETKTSEFQQKELALNLSTTLNSRVFRRGSLIESGEKLGEGMGKSKLEGVADTLLNALISSKGLGKIGGAAGLASGDFFSKLKQGGISGSVIEQLGRVKGGELDVIRSRLVGQAGSRESDITKIRELMPEKQRFSQQLAALEKQAEAARRAIKQTFESIGQIANLRFKMGGREGIMRASGINEQIQGLGSLMGETSSATGMASTNYRAQLASNQLKAATETSEVFAELRSGISDLFNQFDLSRMGDIPANVRGGQSKLMGVLGGNSVGGIGEGAISIFKALGKDEGVNDIKKLMSDSNEKLVEIQQALREGNKIAEIQRNVAIQRAEFDRSLKSGGGLSSFLDRGNKYSQMSDIYGAQFGLQSGIFKGQGAIELVRSYLGAGGKATDSGVSGLLGTAKEERALDIIETQKDLNRAFAGSGLKLGVPSLGEARKLAETQIAAELKTGDSDMERQMAGLERALQSAISSSFGGQMSDAAQVFANVLAGSDTFRLLNTALEKNTQVLAGLEASMKGMKDGLPAGFIASSRAGGNIPMAAAGYEKMMAKAGGYNPGSVRRAGNLIYNSAERVDYLPGVREPVISPPPGSLAGFLHRQKFGGLGFAAVGGPSMGNVDPKVAAFWANYTADARTGVYRNKKTGQFISHRQANELMGRKIFYMPDAPVQTTSPGQQWKANRANVAGPFNFPSRMPKGIQDAPFSGSVLPQNPNLIPFASNFPQTQYAGGANYGDPYLMNKVRVNPFAIAPTGLPLALPHVPSNFRSQTAIPSTGMTMPSVRPIGLPISPAPRKPSTLRMAPTPISGINFSNELNIGHGEYYNLGSDARAYDSPGMTPMELEKTQRGTGGKVAISFKDLNTKGGRPAEMVQKPWQPYYKSPQLVKDSIGPTLPAQAREPRIIEEFKRIKERQLAGEYRAQYESSIKQGANGPQALKQAEEALIRKGFNAPDRLYGGGLPGQANSQRNFIKDVKNLIQPSTTFASNQLNLAKNYISGGAANVGKTASGIFGPTALGFEASGLASSYLGAISGGKRGQRFGDVAGNVGETLLQDTRGMLEDLPNKGGLGLFGQAFGMAASPTGLGQFFGFKESAFDLMESEGDVSAAQGRYNLSKQKRDKRKTLETQSQAIKAYQSTSGTRFQQEQFGLTQGMSPADRVTYFKQQMSGKYGQWGTQEDYQAGLSRASTDANRDTLAKRYNITAPGQLDRLHKGLMSASNSGPKALQDYVAKLDKAFKGMAQAVKPVTEKPKEETSGDKTKLDININMGGNLGIKNTSVEFSEEQYLVINSMIAAVSEGIEKKIKAIADKLPAEVRSSVANTTPPRPSIEPPGSV